MHQSEFWLTLAQRRFQSLLGKLAVQLSTDTPSHHSPGIHVQNYRQVNELLLQPNVGYIRHPELVDTVSDHPARQVRIHPPGMITVGCHHESPPPNTQQVVLTHQPQNALVIDDPSFAPQQSPDSSVSTVPIFDGESLDRTS